MANLFRNDVFMVSDQPNPRTWSLDPDWRSVPVGVVVLVSVVGGGNFGSGPVVDRFRFAEGSPS